MRHRELLVLEPFDGGDGTRMSRDCNYSYSGKSRRGTADVTGFPQREVFDSKLQVWVGVSQSAVEAVYRDQYRAKLRHFFSSILMECFLHIRVKTSR